MSKQSSAGWLAGTIVVMLTAAAYADSLTINKLTLQNVRVTGIADGTMEYISAGSTQTKKLEEISAIEFSRYPTYAQAMALMDTQPGKAAELLQDLVGDVREGFLQPLFQLRASEALDKAGRFEAALELYLEAVAADSSSYFTSRAPSNVPSGDAARQSLSNAIRQADNAEVKQALQGVLTKSAQPTAPAGGNPGDQPPTNGNTEQVDKTQPEPDANTAPEPPVVEVTSARLRTVDNLINNERYDDALAQINTFMANKQASAQLLADLYYYRGRAEAGKGQHFAAALTLLRVPVHFPDHALAVPALELAGHELKADGEADAARTVWQQALEKTDDLTTKRRMQQAIGSL